MFAAVTVLVVLLLRHWMATKQYVFNKEDIAKLAKQYAGEFGNEEFGVLIELQFTEMQLKVKLNECMYVAYKYPSSLPSIYYIQYTNVL